ncbi:MAG: hypothetical protein ACI8W7_002296 [Gammaproteobacteria bacterium]|jgi:hypothetical protein
MRRPGDPTISTDAKPGETLLARWARVKRGALREAPAHEQLPEQDSAHSQAQPEPNAEQETEQETAQQSLALDHAPPVLTDADMPELSSIGDDDDYSGFMSPGVSEGLRNKALRQLFMSAQFNVLDGLNDYDDDFTTFEALGDIVTSDMRHRVQMQAEQAARDAEEQRVLSAQAEQAPLEHDTEPQHELKHSDDVGEGGQGIDDGIDESIDALADERSDERAAAHASTSQQADTHGPALGNSDDAASDTLDEQQQQRTALQPSRSDPGDV